MKDPSLLQADATSLTIDDFGKDNMAARACFFALNNLASQGYHKEISVQELEGYLENFSKVKQAYNRHGGRDFLCASLEKGNIEHYPAYYKELKKYSLFRDLLDHGYDLGPYDYIHVNTMEREKEAKARLAYEGANEEELLGYAEKQLAEVRARHASGAINSTTAAEGLENLVSFVETQPEAGAELPGIKFNSIVRGALLGKMYIRSAATNVGKTRASIHDVCNIVFPVKYSNVKKQWIYYPNRASQKALYIVTEQTTDEVKSMILAWICGLEERMIRAKGNKTEEEKERIKTAIKVMEKYGGNLHIEEINDPDLNNVSSVIMKFIRTENVKYVFYDYIFTSPALLKQFSAAGLREDVILGMLSNQLKEIAKTYNVFIMTSTQLNGASYKDGEKRDARMLRGAKSIADKADTGMILSEVDPVDKEDLKEYMNAYGIPSHVIDIYKLRNGSYKNTRIWIQWNPGNGERRDLFITNQDKKLVNLEPWDIIPELPSEEITNINEFLRKEDINESTNS